MKKLLLLGGIFLILGVLNLPIGYYTFLRITVTLICLLQIFRLYNREVNQTVVVLGVTAFLFNPIIPVYLNNKSLWIGIDLLCGLYLLNLSVNHKEN